ncbi:hypothetical protein ABZ814_23125 [Micromonospora musae]|uniref:hypothetical protein n=1 Tax=Micromonospora musae TaxID=1894970 RepID=UPI00340D61A8
MRGSNRALPATVVATLLLLTGCGSSDDTPDPAAGTNQSTEATSSAAPSPVAMRAEFAGPKPDHVLQVQVKSAVRTGDEIELVLTGTYGGDRSTLWTSTTVEASTDTGNCQVTAAPGFPDGQHLRGSEVTGTWTLTCPGDGQVQLVVDPFGGLLDSDSSFRMTLS